MVLVLGHFLALDLEMCLKVYLGGGGLASM